MLADRLRTFAAFADDPNLSRTARRLGLSQPAVHAQLKALADELAARCDRPVPLYQRSGRGLALTAEGAEIAAFARELEARSDELVARLRGDNDDRPVVLAAGPGALVHLVANGIRAFARSAARPRVEVVTADARQALDLVRRGVAHVGVGVLDAPPDGLEWVRLAHAAQVLVMRRADPLARKRRVRLADLEGASLVAPPEGGPQRAALDAAFAARRVSVHVAAVARGWDVVLRLVEVGVGAGVVNATCVLPRTLVARPLEELPRVDYLAFMRPRPRAAAVELVRAIEGAIASRDR
ncbi:MAG: LysR family transcriptional regulator [Labilithrix sp.]|nr:LysR family transcriptional regulator [Labilithrix sp.]MCW5812072.1 LysR family transcriptional regulator [Labilithrix sp.]